VVGRKNYFGSGAIWSGALAAAAFTVIQTLLLNQVDPLQYLLAYFQACAENGGEAPPCLDAWLPWNLCAEQKAKWKAPKGFP
jgi:hypothetical protein